MTGGLTVACVKTLTSQQKPFDFESNKVQSGITGNGSVIPGAIESAIESGRNFGNESN